MRGGLPATRGGGEGFPGSTIPPPPSHTQQVIDTEEGPGRRDPVADHRHDPISPETHAMQGGTQPMGGMPQTEGYYTKYQNLT